MRKLIAISVASTLLGYAVVHFVFFSKPVPAPVPEQPAAAPTAPAEPVVLGQVVDVTDLELLLDPPLGPLPGQPAGLPFDPTEPLTPAMPVNATPSPIPLAE